jgi:hypothetical protein
LFINKKCERIGNWYKIKLRQIRLNHWSKRLC